MFNDDWMRDQGFVEHERSGDLRDLIGRRHDQGASVTVGPDDTLQVAYARMKLYDARNCRCWKAIASSASSTNPTCCWRCSSTASAFTTRSAPRW